MPKVSIVLPCYNGQRFLHQSLDSIMGQSFTDWELIIVNDNSTDNTPQIAEEYARRDGRIRVIHNRKNKKLPGALNVGFADARGEYFTWTSDDNIAKPNWLSVMVNYLDCHPNTDMVSANMDTIDESGVVLDTFRNTRNYNSNELAHKCNIGAAFMYRRSIADVVGKYDDTMFCAEDYDYWVRIALAGKIDYIYDNIYMYRTNQDSLTATQQPKILARTVAIHNKYRGKWIKKLKLGWLGRQKYDYLLRNFPVERTELSLFGLWHWLTSNLIKVLFFWNRTLRHKYNEIFRIKL